MHIYTEVYSAFGNTVAIEYGSYWKRYIKACYKVECSNFFSFLDKVSLNRHDTVL